MVALERRSASVRSAAAAPRSSRSCWTGTSGRRPRHGRVASAACRCSLRANSAQPASDRSGKAMVGQHSGHIEVFDDEPVVGLDQLVGDLVQEMPTDVRDVVVMAPSRAAASRRLRDPFCLRDNDFASRRWRRMPAASGFGGIERCGRPHAPSVVAATTNADRPRSTPTQPPASSSVAGAGAGGRGAGRRPRRSVTTHHRPRAIGDRGEQDLRAALGQHAPQPAGVVVYPRLADARQGHRTRSIVIADPDRRLASPYGACCAAETTAAHRFSS